MVTLLHNRWVARPSATVAAIVITTSSLPNATQNSAYSASLTASGGSGAYTWFLLSATPNSGGWLSLSSGGIFSGTPTTVEVESIAVLVMDSVGNTASATFNLTVATASGTIYLQEDYNTYPTGNVTSITAALSAKGYTSVTFTNTNDLQILGRGSMPAGLLADPNFPAGKTQVALFTLPALENETRLTWAGFPNTTTRDVSWSWWEYRPNTNAAAEKFMRAGNWVNGTVDGPRGIDAIIGLGNPNGTLTLFSNSGNMHPFPNGGNVDEGSIPWGSPWPPGLYHFERVDHLPTDTSAGYTSSLYVNGVFQGGTTTPLQIYDTAAQAAVGWQLWDFGGWGSLGSGATFPIKRYICAARIASTRQGVWAMNAV